MVTRASSYQRSEELESVVIHVARGAARRRFVLSAPLLAGGATLLGLFGFGVIGAGAYLLFRDDMLAGLLDRQTRMQYAYEDRIAAMRLRLDQLSSRQVVDQDGVEGKVQSLVLRQSQLETRAAVVAQLVEKTLGRDAGLSPAAGLAAEAAAPRRDNARVAPPAARSAPAAGGESWIGRSNKPEPQGMDLRLGHDPEPAKSADGTPLDLSALPAASDAALANAADPDLPLPARLDSLALSLDKVERDQAKRLAGVVEPAREAATRLRRAFDVAGLPVERYIARAKPRLSAGGMGGPFVSAPAGAGVFERALANAQTAVATLDGLRAALPKAPLRKPVSGEMQLTSTFGYRTDPFLGRPALHSGVDLREDYGEPVRATAGGVVTIASPNGGYGNMVEVDHGDGYATRYAHLSAILVSPGQQLAPGAVLGRVGSTGRSTGPHLHYEVRVDGEAVDPQRFLKAAAFLPVAR